MTLAVADQNGHTTLAPVEIAVPHDQREHSECKASVPSPGLLDEDESCRMLAATHDAGDHKLAREKPPASSSARISGGCSAGRDQGLGGLLLAGLVSATLGVPALRKRRRRVNRFAVTTLLAGLTGLATAPVLSGCSGDGDSGGGNDATYPYICACNCYRCIERNPTTGACVSMGRQDFVAPACAASDEEAARTCGEACGRFGTECTWDAGMRASETPCQ